MNLELTLTACQRVIDYEADGARQAYELAVRNGADESLQREYQGVYNAFVILRSKLTPEHLAEIAQWQGPMALERIFHFAKGEI